MFRIIKNSLIILLFINMAACSYSPGSLKETYNDLALEFSEELKEPFDLSATQSAMIDDYTLQVMQWHRRNKLPEYSQNFARLAALVKQENISLSLLKKSMHEIDGIPHFDQASHLTYKILAFAQSLSDTQTSQLERSLNDEYQQESLEIKKESFAKEANDNIKYLFRFVGISLNTNQLKMIKEETRKLQDVRPYELQSNKQWNRQMIALLRQQDQIENANFDSRFSQLWNTQDAKLTGRGHQLEQHNKNISLKLIKRLLMSFNPEQREKLSRQLTSISETFSELTNE